MSVVALSIGELAGYLTLDDSKFEQGLKGAQGKFSQAGDWIKDNGKKLGLAAGAALGAAVTAGVVANINTEKANDKLAAQLGLSAKESGRIGKIAGGLYRDAYGDSIEGVNDAVGAVMSSIKGMSNASAKDLEAVTAKALDFAATFDIDVTRAVQIAGQAVSTGLAKDATQAFDLITAASQKVPAALREDLLDAADEYGPFFETLGYSGKQAFALLVDASEKGMYGIDKAGDAIKEFTIRATDMSETSKDAYKAIGLDAREMANDILAGGNTAQGATRKIIDGLLSIKDPSKQANAAIALFGTPLEDLNVKEIPAFLKGMRGTSKSMDDAAGASSRMGNSLNDNFATRIEGWKRQAKGFAQDAIMAIVRGFEAGEKQGDGFFGLLSQVGAYIKSPLIPTVKSLSKWVKDNADTLKVLGGVVLAGYLLFKTYTTTVLIVNGVTKAWTALTKGQTIAQKALNLAMRLNPIGLVVTALVALGLGLKLAWEKSETFRKVVTTAWEAVEGAALGATRWIVDKVLWMAEKVLGAAAKAFGWAPGIGDKLKAAHEKIKDFRKQVNKELDGISDEDVKIRIAVSENAQKKSDRQLGHIGGGGPLPPAAMQRAAMHGGAMGGSGIIPRVSTSRGALGDIKASASERARDRADEIEAALRKAQRSAGTLGPRGARGNVLPPGSYRIGMPYMGYPGHYGADYPAATGTPVYSPWPGRVVASYDLPGSNPYNSTPFRSYGRVVKIAHANGLSSLFAHLSQRISQLGPVAAGAMIGRVGMNGNATGPHLHYEARRNGSTINPASLGLFDTGGLARNAGLMVKGPRPERVLSPRQTESFEQLVDILSGSDDGDGGAVDEIRALREDVQQLPGRLRNLIDAGHGRG